MLRNGLGMPSKLCLLVESRILVKQFHRSNLAKLGKLYTFLGKDHAKIR